MKLTNCFTITITIYVTDDSGSMKTKDGHRLINDRYQALYAVLPGGQCIFYDCLLLLLCLFSCFVE